MKTVVLILSACALIPAIGRGDDLASPAAIEQAQLRGWITPEFEAVSRQLIAARESARQAQDDEAQLEEKLPALKKAASDEDAKVAALAAELDRYDHPDETDFATLQDAMKDSATKTADRRALAQAFVWTYPTSPHEPEAEKILQQLEAQEAEAAKADQEAAAAAAARQVALLQRVKSHDLDLEGWRSFLQDKSQAEVLQYLGDPASQSADYWAYTGEWTVDPSTHLKAGLGISFNGGRVQNVSPLPPR